MQNLGKFDMLDKYKYIVAVRMLILPFFVDAMLYGLCLFVYKCVRGFMAITPYAMASILYKTEGISLF